MNAPRTAAVLLLAATLFPCAPGADPAPAEAWVLPPEQPLLKAGAGESLVRENCLLCHSVDYITTQPPLARAQWQAEVEKMRGKFGAPVATNAIPGLVAYLAANYGEPPK